MKGEGFRRGALLIEELAVDAVRVADEHVGTPARPSQRALRYREVIAGEVQFGVAGVREQHLRRIRERNLAVAGHDEGG